MKCTFHLTKNQSFEGSRLQTLYGMAKEETTQLTKFCEGVHWKWNRRESENNVGIKR